MVKITKNYVPVLLFGNFYLIFCGFITSVIQNIEYIKLYNVVFDCFKGRSNLSKQKLFIKKFKTSRLINM